MKTKWMLLVLGWLAISVVGCGSSNDGGGVPEPGGEGEQTDPNDDRPLLKTIKVMTYNIHSCNPPSKPGECDVEAIANAIKAENPDIVFLQEVDKNTGRNGNYDDQAAEIGKKIGMNARFFSARAQGKGFYGVAILTKYTIEDTKLYLLPKPADLEQRVLGTAVIKLTSNERIVAAVTHLQHNSHENRLDQINEVIRVLSLENQPVILGGDFNELPTATDFFEPFDEAFVRTCLAYGCPYTFPATSPKSTIDFLAFKPATAFGVGSHQTVKEVYASDHLPVVSVLEFKR